MYEEPSDEENDMLDLAFGLTQTSRLGCQVKLKQENEEKQQHVLQARLPSATRNMAVDGYKPKSH
jgi:ferredoxin-2, mitochondrial